MTTADSAASSLRPVGVMSVVWGSILLVRGGEVFQRLEGRAPDDAERMAIMLLGARHTSQGILQSIAPHRFARAYAAIDAVHAASMLPVAMQARRRRAALASCVLATLAGWAAWRSR